MLCSETNPCPEQKPHRHIHYESNPNQGRDYVFYTIEGYLEGEAFARSKGANLPASMIEVTETGMPEKLSEGDQATLVRMYDEGNSLPDCPDADESSFF